MSGSSMSGTQHKHTLTPDQSARWRGLLVQVENSLRPGVGRYGMCLGPHALYLLMGAMMAEAGDLTIFAVGQIEREAQRGPEYGRRIMVLLPRPQAAIALLLRALSPCHVWGDPDALMDQAEAALWGDTPQIVGVV